MKAILFDMDGTLLESMHAWYHAEVDYLMDQGVPKDAIDYDLLVTLGSDGLADFLRDHLQVEIDPLVMREATLAYMEQFYGGPVEPKSGVEAMLEEISARGIPMAIGSSTPGYLCEMGLDTTGLRRHFDFILSASDEGMGKSDPAFFELAARQFGVDPRDLLVVDDAVFALRAARDAGCKVIGVADAGYDQDEEAVRMESDAFVYAFSDWDVAEGLAEFGWVDREVGEER